MAELALDQRRRTQTVVAQLRPLVGFVLDQPELVALEDLGLGIRLPVNGTGVLQATA